MNNGNTAQLDSFIKETFGQEKHFADFLRKVNYELVNMALNIHEDYLDREVVADAHYYLNQLANLLDPTTNQPNKN